MDEPNGAVPTGAADGGTRPLRVLITGANGQLGRELRRLLAEGRGEIGAIPACYAGARVRAVDVDELDICNESQVEALFADDDAAPDVVFNCAAYTNVDGCEAHEDLARAVNADGPALLAQACAAAGATLVHVSTDYVFPGTDERPRREDDEPAPLSAYGRTKLAGEQAVAEAFAAPGTRGRAHVVRTAWLYGYEGRNFVKTMLGLAERGLDTISVVDDQLGNPTSANDLAYELLRIAACGAGGRCVVWHCTNEGVCSWATFTEAIFELAHAEGIIGNKPQVQRVSSAWWAEQHPESAARPAFSALENARLAASIGNEMRPWRDALASYLRHYRELAR